MIGETIGNFRIVSRLGRGGMGEVYLAEQTRIGTKVAVKLLLPQISADAEHVKRFFNEALAVQRIQHAGIVKIFDVGFHASGQAYLVMEYLEGESLARRIHRLRRLHPAEVADLGRQIASVLEATHGAGITHRDLKPENIYIIPDRELASRQRVKILDFGIAKLTGTLANVSPQTIGTMGTPAYMAPEQWGDASRVDWRADLYSLGCVGFEMTCGRPPFVCTTIAEACGKHLTEQPPRASALVPGTPPELDELLDQLLEKRPDDRPHTMDEVVRRFEALAAQLGPAPTTPASAPYVAPPAALPSGTPHHPPGATVGTGYGAPPPAIGATVGTGYGATPPPAMGATVGTGYGATAMPVAAAPTTPPKRRRGLALALGGIAIAGVGAAIAVVATSHGGGTTPPPSEAFCENTRVPVLDGASTEPVLLRYAFRTYQKTEVTMIAEAKTTVTTDGRKADDLTITIEGVVSWTVLNAEQFAGVLQPARLSVEHKAETDPASGKPTHETVRWSTDDPGPPPGEYAVLTTLVGARFQFTIASRGQLVSSNISTIQDALAAAHASTTIKAAFARDEVFRTMFLRLPEKPVQVGETWRGGEYLHELPNKNSLSAKVDFTLAAVSADRKQILITAAPELQIDLSGTVSIVSKQTAFHLWSELDLDRGELIATAIKSCAKLALDANGTHTTVDSEYSATYEARPLGNGLVPYQTPDAGVPVAAIDAAPIDADAAPIDAPPRVQPKPRDAGVAASPRVDARVATVPPVPIDAPPALPPDDVRPGLKAMIAAAKPDLQKCAPADGGTVTVSLKIGSDGRLSNIAVRGPDDATAACVTAVLRPLTVVRGENAEMMAIAFPILLGPNPSNAAKPPDGAERLPDVPGKLQQVLTSANDAALACGDGFLGSVTASVDLTIAPDGSVSRASSPKTEPPPLRACVERTIKALRFMPSKRGKTVSYSYKVQR